MSPSVQAQAAKVEAANAAIRAVYADDQAWQDIAAYVRGVEDEKVRVYVAGVEAGKAVDAAKVVATTVATGPAGNRSPDRASSTGGLFVDVGRWERIHTCEEGSSWVNDGWTSDGHFQGGLGMSVDAWASVIGEAASYGIQLPSSSNDATPYEQMEGAQILFNRVGPSAWGCK